ncbi:hypothetical protein [Roseibium sp.]|uniref:hypothetical protein n=1 Tax=Roseibium sp. TaxID=1936156 RepID=UPI003B502DDB
MLLFFNPLLRFVLFWGVVTAVLSAASQNLSWIDVAGVIDTLSGVAGPGGLEAVSKKEFAFSLAGLIFTFAVGMALAFTVCHLLPVLWALKAATRRVFRGVKRNSSPADRHAN